MKLIVLATISFLMTLATPGFAGNNEPECEKGELVVCDGANECAEDEDWVRRCGKKKCRCRARPPRPKKPIVVSASVASRVAAGFGLLGAIGGGVLTVMSSLAVSGDDSFDNVKDLGLSLGLVFTAVGVTIIGAREIVIPVEVAVGPTSVVVGVRF